jgi:hypothetical protein
VLPEVRAAVTAKQVPDRYLLGLARRNGGRVATSDRALAAFGAGDVVSLRPPIVVRTLDSAHSRRDA